MKLIVTDGATLNPGDLSWDAIRAFGEFVYYDTTPKELAAERCQDAAVIICNKTVLSAEAIRKAKNLKLIAVTATGYNNVDIQAAKAANVVVCNVPEYGTYSVAQHCFALLLELVNHVGINSRSTRNNGWTISKSWSYTLRPVTELKDKVFGIIGFGRIGQQVANLAHAFGMKVIFNNRSVVTHPFATQLTLDEVFAECDVLSLHCPLTDSNRGFVNLERLRTMKPTALLINTSRGPLINEGELRRALDDHLIAGAALDVLTEEPPPAGHPLTDHPQCIVTPHNAWISTEARATLMRETVKNLESFFEGRPRNVVSGQ